jgi:uncharacterized membrane protein
MTKTVVGLFDDFSTAQNAVRELINNGFARENISIITNDADGRYARDLDGEGKEEKSNAASGAGLGAALGGFAGLLVGLGTFLIPGIGPILAAGPIITALGGAGLGALAGGLVGALIDAGIPDEDANIFAEGVQRGGTLVVAYVTDANADQAADIMNRNQPIDIEERSAAWRDQNWAGDEGGAEPFAFDQTRQQPANRGEGRRTNRPNPVRFYTSNVQVQEAVPPAGDREDFQEQRFNDWRMYESRFRDHYEMRYSNLGSWEDFRASYRYGFEQGGRSEFSNAEWDHIRAELRQGWEQINSELNWVDHEDAVRQGWLTGRTPR